MGGGIDTLQGLPHGQSDAGGGCSPTPEQPILVPFYMDGSGFEYIRCCVLLLKYYFGWIAFAVYQIPATFAFWARVAECAAVSSLDGGNIHLNFCLPRHTDSLDYTFKSPDAGRSTELGLQITLSLLDES